MQLIEWRPEPPPHCKVCEARLQPAHDEVRQKCLAILEQQHALRLRVYRECRARFTRSHTDGFVACIRRLSEKILKTSTNDRKSDDAAARKKLKGQLAKLDQTIPCLRSLFLELPLKPARKNILIHGDHLQGVPLYGALLQGIAAIETDVRYHKNHLVIAHDEADLKLGVKFEDLYLKPLQELVKERPFLFDDKTPLSIFIDLKLSQSDTPQEESDQFYGQLYALIEKYKEMLEHYDSEGTLQPGPVRLVITGDDRRVRQLAQRGLNEAYLFLDGRFEDVECPKELVIMRSIRYPLLWDWQWIEQDHRSSNISDLPLRFWSVPGDTATSLQQTTADLWEAFKGRDIVYNTDYPTRLIAFLDSQDEQVC